MFVEPYLQDLRRDRYRPRAAARYVWRCALLSARAARRRPRALRGVAFAGIAHLLVLFGVSVALNFLVDPALAIDAFVSAAWWLLAGLAWVTLHLGMFREDEELPRSGLGLPNVLTLGRLLCVPLFYLFATRGREELALAVLGIGALTDVADGAAARLTGTMTRLGKLFDPLVDVCLAAGVALALTRAGLLPEWILALVFLRYGLLILGGAWIYVARGPVSVRPTVLGKTTGAVSGILVAGVLAADLWIPEASRGQVLGLVHAAIGFVLLLTIVQVVALGIDNMRHAGRVSTPEGPLRLVLGESGEEDRAP